MLAHMAFVSPIGTLARAWHAFCRSGPSGVDIFFVLSGFLITGVLLDTRRGGRYFLNFYARRILRIFPLYYAVVFMALVVLPAVSQTGAEKLRSIGNDAVWYWLYLSNFAIARRGAFVHGVLDVSWSLSIEEQFYLAWPLVVRFTSQRRLGLVCIALVLLSCFARIALAVHRVNPIAIHTLTFCRLDGLAIGALTALCVRRFTIEELRSPLVPVLVSTALFAGLMLTLTRLEALPLLCLALTSPAISLFAAGLILAAASSASRSLTYALSVTPLRVLGRYSYAMYLFHRPLSAALRDTVLKPANLPRLFGSSLPSQLLFDSTAIALTLSVALVSWHAYEKWFLKLKRYFGAPEQLAS